MTPAPDAPRRPGAGGHILLVWERMGPYHVARWRALEALLAPAGRQVYAADLQASDTLYGWTGEAWSRDPRYRVLSKKGQGQGQGGDGWGRFARLRHLCKKEGIGTVGLAGYYRPEMLLTLIWAWATGRRVVLFAESWYPGLRWADALKGWFLRLTCRGFLVSGERAAGHFLHRLRIGMDRLRIGYSVVDNAHFARARALRPPGPPPRQIICVARLAPEKDVPTLIEAFRQAGLTELGWSLSLVGSGPDKEAIRSMIAPGEPITLEAWVGYEDLPAHFARASVAVLPSHFEPWGLVCNEALAAGCTLVCSSAVGAVPDLLSPETGRVFPPGDVAALARILEGLARGPVQLLVCRDCELGPPYTLEAWAGNFAALAGLPVRGAGLGST